MTNEENKRAQALMNYFQKKYEEKYKQKPILNRNKIQYLLFNVLKDLSVVQVKKLIDFYVKTDRNPTLLYFCYEYDEVAHSLAEHEGDLLNRKTIMSDTQKAVIEYRKRYGRNA